MSSRQKNTAIIILAAIYILLVAGLGVLAFGFRNLQNRYESSQEQWAKKEKKYKQQIRKLKKQNAVEGEEGQEAAGYDVQAYLESLDADSFQPGNVLEPEDLDMENISQHFRAYGIVEGDSVYQRINGKSYRDNPDIGLEELSYLKLLHYDYEGRIRVGELIVNKLLAEDVLEIFQELFENQYQVQSMRLVDDYWTGDGITSDSASIDANNTSAFNYRRSTEGNELSNHAYGRAIDINPLQNPYIWYDEFGNPTGEHADECSDRESGKAHMIGHEDLCCRLFLEHGFTWGGDWTNPVDYQHFEKRQ